MDENELGEKLLGCALTVHRALGPGLLENAYEACLSHELTKEGIDHQRQVALPIIYDGVRIDLGYRLDLLLEGKVIVELKSVRALTDVHRSQLLSEARRLPPRVPAQFQCRVAQEWHMPSGKCALRCTDPLRPLRSPRFDQSGLTAAAVTQVRAQL